MLVFIATIERNTKKIDLYGFCADSPKRGMICARHYIHGGKVVIPMAESKIIDLVQKLLALPEENRQYIYGVTTGLALAQELEKKKIEELRAYPTIKFSDNI